MWLYTSYAVQPHRSVASKNGDFRYHGPKYKVLDVTSGVALASPLTAHPPSTGGCLRHEVREPPAQCSSLPTLRLNRRSIRSTAQGEPAKAHLGAVLSCPQPTRSR